MATIYDVKNGVLKNSNTGQFKRNIDIYKIQGTAMSLYIDHNIMFVIALNPNKLYVFMLVDEK
jgi:hypothetical protein